MAARENAAGGPAGRIPLAMRPGSAGMTDQVLRLGAFREAHPGVTFGHGEECGLTHWWQAVFTDGDGTETIVTRWELASLLDALDEMHLPAEPR